MTHCTLLIKVYTYLLTPAACPLLLPLTTSAMMTATRTRKRTTAANAPRMGRRRMALVEASSVVVAASCFSAGWKEILKYFDDW